LEVSLINTRYEGSPLLRPLKLRLETGVLKVFPDLRVLVAEVGVHRLAGLLVIAAIGVRRGECVPVLHCGLNFNKRLAYGIDDVRRVIR